MSQNLKGIIYYTENRLEEPIKTLVREHIKASGLPIVSVSLKPIDFGENVVVEGKPCYPTMVNQIVAGLETSKEKYVFFCEHDVLYHPSHFNFTPPRDDTYYYNIHNWRWEYPNDKVIRYDRLTSLSMMCANRELALDHYKRRQKRIAEMPEKFESREPKQARVWGYEPGRKTVTSGGFSLEKSDEWYSEFPNIDIRHRGTFSPPKTKLSGFKHLPTGWVEETLENVSGWNLKELFNL